MDKLYCLNCKKIFNDDQDTRKRKYQLSMYRIHSHQAEIPNFEYNRKKMHELGTTNKTVQSPYAIYYTVIGTEILLHNKLETSETVRAFWRWMHSTIFNKKFDKQKYMDKYHLTNKFMINCPYCLSNRIINATEFIENNKETFENKKLKVYNKYLQEKKGLYDELKMHKQNL